MEGHVGADIVLPCVEDGGCVATVVAEMEAMSPLSLQEHAQIMEYGADVLAIMAVTGSRICASSPSLS
jgi:hypothetical protein